MSLNIKNERVHALAREAARLTGKNQTSVIEEALVRLLAELDRAARNARAEEILKAMQDAVAGGPPVDSDFLYDENGLPA